VIPVRRWLAALLTLLLAECITDDRHAGTSTSVTNPVGMVTGLAILKDGTVAAGARILVRMPAIRAMAGGTPASMVVTDTVADSAGKFTVPLVFMQDCYLEIREAPGQRPGRASDSLEIFLRRWPDGLPLDGKFGTFRLATAGDILGHYLTADTTAAAKRWIGVRGTDNFIPVPDTTPFSLKGVPAGLRELVEVEVPETGSSAASPTVRDTLNSGTVESGIVNDFGPVLYQRD